jgi:lipoate-protein ligase A
MKRIDSSKNLAERHMQLDAALLSSVEEPTLHLYDFHSQPAITYGYFVDPAKWLKNGGGDTARRPTGGGLIFHEEDFSFTLALPASHKIASLATLERYQLINGGALEALLSLFPEHQIELEPAPSSEERFAELCMAHATQYDLMCGGKKVGGAAQRKTKSGFIHQCSIFLLEPPWEKIEALLKAPQRVIPALKSCTAGIFREAVPRAFRESFAARLEAAINAML